MKRLSLLLGLLLAAATLMGEEPAVPIKELPPILNRIDNIRVKDGDTIQADIYLGFDVILTDQSIRCLDYDAWEASKRRRSVRVTDKEVEKGLEAKEFLVSLSEENTLYVEENEKRSRDNYGRILGRVFLVSPEKGLRSLSVIMKAEGHDRNVSTD